jgi:hypothetical protein
MPSSSWLARDVGPPRPDDALWYAMLQVVAKGREFLYIREVFSWDPRKALIT